MDKNIYLEGYSQNRDLSWLNFNERVLMEAIDETVPVLERLKFISIFSHNLDEFFMIRVGSIFQMLQLPKQKIDYRSGLSNQQQLDAIYERVKYLYEKQNEIYKSVKKELGKIGIKEVKINQLTKNEKSFVNKYFKENVLPILSPQVVDVVHPFPFISSKEVTIITRMNKNKKVVCGLLSVPASLPPIIILPSDNMRYILMEDVIMYFVDKIFKSFKIIEKAKFCITRNADINPNDEDLELSVDFRKSMGALLKKRRRLNTVRVEVANKISKGLEKMLLGYFTINSSQIFRTKIPLRIDYSFYFINKINSSLKENNIFPVFTPVESRFIKKDVSLFEQLKKRDILLHFPYESMNTFIDLIKEASGDNNVTSISITIYRLSSRSRLIEYLCRAAENGIDVTVLIELRARFDEQNNINWSQELEDAGCRIIYGFEDFKVHSKICSITRKEGNGIKYYTYIGTGNFNESTAKQYSDFGLISCDNSIGKDASDFFKNMLLEELGAEYNSLLVSPNSLKSTVIKHIEEETLKKENGYIFIKINSITDIEIIEKLKTASMNNVPITMIVRGICCILPGIKGLTDNIKIYSIVGRFLEHSRVYIFGKGSDEKIYISSADFMTRNTERRVEVATVINDYYLKKEIKTCMNMMLKDNVKARMLNSEGKYVKIFDEKLPYDSQVELINRYKRLYSRRRKW